MRIVEKGRSREYRVEMAVVRDRSSPSFVDVTAPLLPLQQMMSRNRGEGESEGSGYGYSRAQHACGKVKDALLMYGRDLVVWP